MSVSFSSFLFFFNFFLRRSGLKAMSVVIEDDIPEDFEPSEEEVNEYAKWLGMDLPTDQHLLWIAREGIKAPLPDDWKPCKSSSGDIYYFNFRTGDSRWEHPQVIW
jgi:centrosomal protein CEP164